MKCELPKQDCVNQLVFNLGDKDPAFTVVKHWYNEFNRRCCSLKEKRYEARPKSVLALENTDSVQKLIMPNGHVT